MKRRAKCTMLASYKNERRASKRREQAILLTFAVEETDATLKARVFVRRCPNGGQTDG